jgi:Fe-S-cluster-containing dehydrogenase component
MKTSRRDFLKQLGGMGSVAVLGSSTKAFAGEHPVSFPDHVGVLVDTTLCVGCRSCEKACNEINKDLPQKPREYFQDAAVFNERRRMDGDAYTVVNAYNPEKATDPVYVKFQCMHCLEPACMSACIVGAFSKDANGAVIYDPWKCIGCRYCMAACPFQVPAYEFDNAFTPQVRKCTFCFTERTSQGRAPACVQSCPMEVMTFGKRGDLIALAKERIEKYPDRYEPHIYGEHEVGGTAWLYLSNVPFEAVDLPKFGAKGIPQYTEPIQHAIFKHFIPPFALYGILGGIMWYLKPKKEKPEPALDEKGAQQ